MSNREIAASRLKRNGTFRAPGVNESNFKNNSKHFTKFGQTVLEFIRRERNSIEKGNKRMSNLLKRAKNADVRMARAVIDMRETLRKNLNAAKKEQNLGMKNKITAIEKLLKSSKFAHLTNGANNAINPVMKWDQIRRTFNELVRAQKASLNEVAKLIASGDSQGAIQAAQNNAKKTQEILEKLEKQVGEQQNLNRPRAMKSNGSGSAAGAEAAEATNEVASAAAEAEEATKEVAEAAAQLGNENAFIGTQVEQALNAASQALIKEYTDARNALENKNISRDAVNAYANMFGKSNKNLENMQKNVRNAYQRAKNAYNKKKNNLNPTSGGLEMSENNVAKMMEESNGASATTLGSRFTNAGRKVMAAQRIAAGGRPEQINVGSLFNNNGQANANAKKAAIQNKYRKNIRPTNNRFPNYLSNNQLNELAKMIKNKNASTLTVNMIKEILKISNSPEEAGNNIANAEAAAAAKTVYENPVAAPGLAVEGNIILPNNNNQENEQGGQ